MLPYCSLQDLLQFHSQSSNHRVMIRVVVLYKILHTSKLPSHKCGKFYCNVKTTDKIILQFWCYQKTVSSNEHSPQHRHYNYKNVLVISVKFKMSSISTFIYHLESFLKLGTCGKKSHIFSSTNFSSETVLAPDKASKSFQHHSSDTIAQGDSN